MPCKRAIVLVNLRKFAVQLAVIVTISQHGMIAFTGTFLVLSSKVLRRF